MKATKAILSSVLFFTICTIASYGQSPDSGTLDSTHHHHRHLFQEADRDDSLHHHHGDHGKYPRRLAVGLVLSNYGQELPGFEQLNANSYSTPFVNSQAYWTNSKATAITSGLYIDYLLRGGLGLHAEAGYRYWNLHNKFDSRNLNTQGPPTSNGGYDISQTNYNQNVYYMQLGMKKELFHKNGFHLHAGLNALILLRNNMNCESTDYSYDATGAGFSGTHTSYTGDDAYALGLNGSLGFDIHLFRNFFAGADITQAYMYTNIYGNETDQVDFLYSPRPSIVYRYPEGIQRFAFSSVCFAFHLGLRL
jgi:hypothetical protein